MKIVYYLKLARIYQYTKNLFVLAPAFFGFLLFDKESVEHALLAFISFCFISSSIYIINDILDYKQDLLHPKKRFRPIASGAISKTNAGIFATILFVLSIIICIINNKNILAPILLYFVLNIAYCIKLKHVALLDIFIISTGFVLRIITGGIAISVTPSHWIIILTFLLALFLALAKRRDDLIIYEKDKVKTRIAIDGYNKQFVDIAMAISATLCITGYIFYSISEDVIVRMHSDNLYITTIFVLLGIFRYMQITFVLEKSGSPSQVVLTDIFLQLIIVAWLVTFLAILYF